MSHKDVKVVLYACDANVVMAANALSDVARDMDFAEKGWAVYKAVECMLKGTCNALAAYKRVLDNAVHSGILFASSCTILKTAFDAGGSRVYGDVVVPVLVYNMLRWELQLLRSGAKLVLYSKAHPVRELRRDTYAKLWALYSGIYASSLAKAAEIAARYAGLSPKPPDPLTVSVVEGV